VRHPLRPCAGCARHVRANERRCPFCSAEGRVTESPIPRPSGLATSRAAVLFFGAAAVVGCGGTTTPASGTGPTDGAPADSAVDHGDAAIVDGPATTEAGGFDADEADVNVDGAADDGSDDAASVDAGPDHDAGTIPLYGNPPIDAGRG
jgi:hypothetical protein